VWKQGIGVIKILVQSALGDSDHPEGVATPGVELGVLNFILSYSVSVVAPPNVIVSRRMPIRIVGLGALNETERMSLVAEICVCRFSTTRHACATCG
jgi:hypothetical protein